MSDITIPVECEACGEELSVEIHADHFSRVQLRVKPCETCMRAEFERGQEEETDHETE